MIKMDLVQEYLAAPIAKVLAVRGLEDPLEDAAVADAKLRQRIGAGADRIVRQGRLEGGVHDQRAKFAAVLRNRQHGFRQIEAYRAFVEHFDAVLDAACAPACPWCPSRRVNSVSAAKVDKPRFDEPSAGSDQRRIFQATCSAVSNSPLCHITPARTFSVQVLRSAEGFHDSINMGRTTLSAPTMVRYSSMGRV